MLTFAEIVFIVWMIGIIWVLLLGAYWLYLAPGWASRDRLMQNTAEFLRKAPLIRSFVRPI